MVHKPLRTKTYVIAGGHVIDPSQGLLGVFNVFVTDGIISEISNRTPPDNYETIDARGLVVTPGFIDIHTHLREPGFEYKEDIETGGMAAVAGGFTTILCMPNTKPVNDNVDTTRYILNRAREVGLIKIIPVGAISKGLEGRVLADIKGMAKEGILAISDDGRSVQDNDIMLKGMEEAKKNNLVVISHPEDHAISKDGVINEGRVAAKLKLKGIPREAENNIIERDINLARKTGARLHIAHVSTKEGIDLVRKAKGEGLSVTCEVTPHHLMLTEDAVLKYGANAKMNPPLRTEADRAALIDAIKDGTVDAIATDHAPHSPEEKRDIKNAPFGVIGMETALPVCMKLLEGNFISIERLIELLTTGPAKAVNLNAGTLAVGASADIAIIDLNKGYKIDANSFKSKGRNTPFDGWDVKGRVLYTLTNGHRTQF